MTPKLLTMRVCIPFILVLIFAAFGFYVPEEENMSEIVFSHMPPNGRTGAPGENFCTQCHTGSVLNSDGFVEFSFSGGTQYTPGEEYQLSIQLLSGGVKSGFQIVALDENDNNAGELIANDLGDVEVDQGGGRTYLSQTGFGVTRSSWDFGWIAPPNAVGTVSFYYTVNDANDDGATSGDKIYVGSMQISPSTSSVRESGFPWHQFEARIMNGQLELDVPNPMKEPVTVTLTNLQGQTLTHSSIHEIFGLFSTGNVDVAHLPQGVYLVHVFVGNKAKSKKVFIP